MDVWLRTLTAVQHLEQQLELKVSDVAPPTDRWCYAASKQLGQILDAGTINRPNRL